MAFMTASLALRLFFGLLRKCRRFKADKLFVTIEKVQISATGSIIIAEMEIALTARIIVEIIAEPMATSC